MRSSPTTRADRPRASSYASHRAVILVALFALAPRERLLEEPLIGNRLIAALHRAHNIRVETEFAASSSTLIPSANRRDRISFGIITTGPRRFYASRAPPRSPATDAESSPDELLITAWLHPATTIDRAVDGPSASLARGRGTRPGKGDVSAMRIIKVKGTPYTVINGKDFAVYRWYAPQQHGPVFIQVAGRTSLSKEDLPTDDWIVKGGKDRGNRIATAWRKQWFDYRPDATRKLAFLGGSTEGSYYLALRYFVRRFGLIASEMQIAIRASEFAQGAEAPYSFCLDRSRDCALTETALVTLDIPSYFEASTAAQLFGAEVRA